MKTLKVSNSYLPVEFWQRRNWHRICVEYSVIKVGSLVVFSVQQHQVNLQLFLSADLYLRYYSLQWLQREIMTLLIEECRVLVSHLIIVSNSRKASRWAIHGMLYMYTMYTCRCIWNHICNVAASHSVTR